MLLKFPAEFWWECDFKPAVVFSCVCFAKNNLDSFGGLRRNVGEQLRSLFAATVCGCLTVPVCASLPCLCPPDSGLVVPSVSYELHKKLLAVAEKHGLTLERRLEMTGVCASQMALSLLGGPNRYWGASGGREGAHGVPLSSPHKCLTDKAELRFSFLLTGSFYGS